MSPRAFFAELDKELLILVMAIGGLGVVNLFSASQSTRPGAQYLQLAYLGVGLVLAMAISALDTDWLQRLAYPIYLTICVLLVLVLVVGTTVKGSQRWLGLGFFNLQPSELMKLAIVFAMARYLSRIPQHEPLTLMDLLRPLNPSRVLGAAALIALRFDELAVPDSPVWTGLLRGLVIIVVLIWAVASFLRCSSLGWPARIVVAPIDLMALPAVLILVEPDLGTTLIVLAISGTMVLFLGVRLRSLGVMAVVGVLGAVAAWFKVLKAYQKQRILTFLNPEADALGAGYHANQSMIAIGSGGVQGKGFMEGTQTQLSFLPENHTDFVFSVLAEEWGLFGAVVLLVLFTLLLVKGVRIAAGAKDRFGALAAIGVTGVVFWQMLVNIGMVTGLMPVVGVTLPLMSYGGSSVLTVMMCVGVWLAVARKRPSF